jgi:hypothetical protein
MTEPALAGAILNRIDATLRQPLIDECLLVYVALERLLNC